VARVYSTRLLDLAAVTHGAIVCPPSMTVVIRDIDVFQAAGEVDGYYVLNSPAGAAFAFAEFSGSGAQFSSWRGRQVLQPGETANYSSANPTYVVISGYLLSLP